MEFCLALPPQQKMQQGWTRLVMRRAMAGILPREVQWRGSKANFTALLNHGLLVFEQECLKEVILKEPGVIEKYVDVTALREAYHRFVSRKATNEDVLAIFTAVSLAPYLKHTGLTS